MDWVQVIVQWLHVLAGIAWFGTVLYGDFILIPALMTLQPDVQRAAGAAIGLRAKSIIPRVAMAVIALGFLRGTVWGRIQSVEALTTTYGYLWLTGLVLAVATFAWGKLVLEPAIGRLSAIDPANATLPDGRPNPELVAAGDALKRLGLIELVLFLAIFTCMILMRFN